MKTNLIHNLPVIAVMASILLLPFSMPAACTALTLSGVMAIFLADYGRTVGPLASIA